MASDGALPTWEEFYRQLTEVMDTSKFVQEKCPHHKDYIPLHIVLTTVPKIQSLLYFIWTMSFINQDKTYQREFTYEGAEQLFINLGFGDIYRYFQDNGRDKFKKWDKPKFMTKLCLYLLREMLQSLPALPI